MTDDRTPDAGQAGGTKPSLEELRKRASELNIDGRTKMNREELDAAIAAAEAEEHASLEELRKVASELDVDGRSTMTRDELEVAIADAQRERTPRTAFVGVMGALFNDHDTDRPATDEEVGRPPLIEVAAARAAARSHRNR